MIRKFRKEPSTNFQSVADILSDAGIAARPTKDNIEGLLMKAAKTTLIKNRCFGMQKLVKGLRSFWNHVTIDSFDAVFSRTIPTSDGVIESFSSLENTKQEGKITWLHRYVRCCSQEELVRFVRFVTGSSLFIPNTVIKVEFVDQQISH